MYKLLLLIILLQIITLFNYINHTKKEFSFIENIVLDSDNDGIDDTIDLDDDNDGILDSVECTKTNFLFGASMESYSSCPPATGAGSIQLASGWDTSDRTWGGQLMVNDPISGCVSSKPAESWPASTSLPSGSDGKAWLGIHSLSTTDGEDAINTLAQAMPIGAYEFTFDGGYISYPPYYSSSGKLVIFGIDAANNETFLGEVEITNLLTNTSPNWKSFTIDINSTTIFTKIKFQAREITAGSPSYMYFDNLRLEYLAEVCDTDNDGIINSLDLDSDNDGIYDAEEAGHGKPHTTGVVNGSVGNDGIPDAVQTIPNSGTVNFTVFDTDGDGDINSIESDSDNDGCSDVIEAGFTDDDADDYLGNDIVTVDSYGIVNNATDGYTTPHPNYIIAAPITITTQPIDSVVCELSNIILSVVSSTYDTIQWEVSTDGGLNWNTIVDDATYSGSQTADLTIYNTPLSFNTYKYRAFLELTGNGCGLYSDLGELTVFSLPVANTAPNVLSCDDDNNGTMPFDLTLQNSAISTAAGMTITYHTSQADADNGANPITSPFESGSATIYARVENDAKSTCYDISSFDLEVFDSALPLLNVTPLQECDNTSMGTDVDGFIIFDLTQKENEILNGQSASDFSLTYFTDAAYTNQIITPSTYTNAIAGNQTIYVRVTNNLYSNCHTDTAFEIEVFELPVVNNPNIYAQCDDASNDGQAFFNLTLDLIKEEINPNYIAKGLTFTYYLTQNDAQNVTNPIPNPDSYQDALGFIPETVWVRVENPNGCFREVPLTLLVNPSSAALSVYNPIPIYQCDDGLDTRDGVATFNFTHIRDHISNNIFSTFNASVHFYETQMDAELETNEISDISSHQNTNSPNTQSIWVRIKSDIGNNCLGLEELPNLLIVEALPFANLVSVDRQCDYDTSDTILSYPFDTSLVESTVLGNQNSANVNIRYFDEMGTELPSPLPNPFLTKNQTITILVTNNNTQDPNGPCYDETTLAFIVDEQPIIANTVAPQIACDGDSGDVDDDDYFPFDTSSFSGTILGTQTNMEIYFDYVDENGNFIVDSPTLPNPLNSTNQTVNVDVINPINPNCYANTTIDLIVNPLPDFYIDSEYIVCTSDPTFAIELDPVESNDIESFTYEWRYTSIDGSTVNQLLTDTTPTINVSIPGTYHVTLTKTDGTGCSRTRDIFVNASELATITHDDVTIIDFNENNNSVTIDTTKLGQGNYEFALVEQDSNFINYQDAPEFNNVKPGFYTIYVNDKNGCGASTLDISVIGYMKFFTPNNDGFNDYWKIIGVNAFFQPNSRILVFDRYGKLLKQISTLGEGWDGTYNGNMMPSDDYWFKVLLEDGREFMGHFALKR
ncbi:T9SS type B sorting domain-containing protein [Aestuariivivens marinum]|uniref:T9SS type B sorting domain-containing protein n=1 Tax=Aestuariivivens marinum TaxID=2913555 RepID=UPI001F5611E3|nr:T9SS type B sorting domain-containing protein [Aestuariivivens marinum]